MTQELHVIDKTRDAEHGWQRAENFKHAEHDCVVPILHSELHMVIPYYPVAVVQGASDRRSMLVALLGMHHNDNLYVNRQGQWMVDYVPSAYRGYPFVLQPLEGKAAGEVRGVLTFNMKSGLFRENPSQNKNEESFFDADGEPQPIVKKVLEFLQKSAVHRQYTQVAVDALAQARLLRPWKPNFANPDAENPVMQGLQCIDAEALQALDHNALKSLHDKGALMIAYAQILSMPRIAVLGNLYQMKYAASPQGGSSVPDSIDALFGEEDNSKAKFNWQNLG